MMTFEDREEVERIKRELVARAKFAVWHGPVTEQTLLKKYDDMREIAAVEFRLTKRVNQVVWLLLTHWPSGFSGLEMPEGVTASMQVPFEFNNGREKQIVYGWIRTWADNMRAVSVIVTSEMWMSMRDDIENAEHAKRIARTVEPRLDPKRKEIVQVSMVSPITDPQTRSIQSLIHRPRGGRPYLGKWGYAWQEARGEPLGEPDPMSGMVGDLFDLIPYMHSAKS